MTLNARPALLAALLLAAIPARADLTLTGISMAGAFGMPMSSQEQIRIREHQIRRDFVDRGRLHTHLFDLEKHRVAVIDHAARRIEMHDLKNMRASAEVSAPTDRLKMNLERTGQTRPLRNWTCEAYTLAASIPTRLGQEETVFHLKGQVWLAPEAPEQAEVKALVKLSRQGDFFVGIPAIAKVTPAQTQLLSEIIRKLAPKGLPCAGDLEASYEGNGPMANLARKMPTRMNIAFQDYSSQPLTPALFALPPGFPVLNAQP